MNKRKLEIFVDTHLQLCEACVSDAGTIYRAIDLHRDDLRRWLPFVDVYIRLPKRKISFRVYVPKCPSYAIILSKFFSKVLFADLLDLYLPIRSIVRPRSGTVCYRNFAGGASCLVVLRDCVYGRSMSGR